MENCHPSQEAIKGLDSVGDLRKLSLNANSPRKIAVAVKKKFSLSDEENILEIFDMMEREKNADKISHNSTSRIPVCNILSRKRKRNNLQKNAEDELNDINHKFLKLDL